MLLVGDRLKNERQKKNLSINDISAKTNIYKGIIERIEQNDFANYDSKVYIEGYLKLYAEELNLCKADIIDHYKRSIIAESETPFELLVPQFKRKLDWKVLLISLEIIVIILVIIYVL